MRRLGREREYRTLDHDARQGHANMATIRLYERRQSRPEERPTFKVEYETG